MTEKKNTQIFNLTAREINSDRIHEVTVSRENAMRGRLRTETSNGEDLIVDLPRGRIINDGDIYGPSSNGYYYKISIEPEPVIKVMIATTETSKDVENAIKLGYTLGNRHLEVLIEKDAAYIPVTIGEEKITQILKRTNLPLKSETIRRVISTTATGYQAGEEEHS